MPNFGPGTDPGVLRGWAQTVEGLGFGLLMISDHVVITPDVAAQYPAPFYEPLTTLAWLAGVTTKVRLGTTVLLLPYRHPLLVARMAANLNQLSGGRLVLGVGVGWARQEFDALGASYDERGKVSDEAIAAIRRAWADEADYRAGDIPIWVGGHSAPGLRRTVLLGDGWHPLHRSISQLRDGLARLAELAAHHGRPRPAFTPRITLRITAEPVTTGNRPAGTGTIEQITADLEELRLMGAASVVLDPFNGDPEETLRPDRAWQALATVRSTFA